MKLNRPSRPTPSRRRNISAKLRYALAQREPLLNVSVPGYPAYHRMLNKRGQRYKF